MSDLAHQLRSVAMRYRRSGRPLPDRLAARAQPRLHQWLSLPRSSSSAGSAATAGREARRSRLEALLFLANEPLTLRKLSQLANLTDATEARTLLAHLRRCYDQRGSAFQVEQLAGGHQLLTRPKFAAWLRPLAPTEREIRLSAPALETLSVVAYRQPVLRVEVEAIRGVTCGEILRQLMDRDLLRIVGRSEELGRPLRYGTTKRFLESFGLRNLEQLPQWSQLRRQAPPSSPDDSVADGLSQSHASQANSTDGLDAA